MKAYIRGMLYLLKSEKQPDNTFIAGNPRCYLGANKALVLPISHIVSCIDEAP